MLVLKRPRMKPRRLLTMADRDTVRQRRDMLVAIVCHCDQVAVPC